jgi:hypothetical protein
VTELPIQVLPTGKNKDPGMPWQLRIKNNEPQKRVSVVAAHE